MTRNEFIDKHQRALVDFNAAPRDLRDALRTVFGSRAEVTEPFRELEAQMIARMRAICERAKKTRRAETPLLEDDLPAADSAGRLPKRPPPYGHDPPLDPPAVNDARDETRQCPVISLISFAENLGPKPS